ncbi:MAG: 3-isopropylmalate dehydratase small subunit [Thermoproteota archaeon]
MIIEGRVWKFGDDVNTDLIIAGKYKYDTLDMKEMSKHAFEAARPEFSESVQEGDIIVAGENFGCGSSREQAPAVLKASGIKAIVAESFARIFYRNSINLGIPVLVCEGISSSVQDGDPLRIDLEENTVGKVGGELSLRFNPLSPWILEIIKEGGVVPYVKKHGSIRPV